MAVYLRLFHGRETPDHTLDDWGTDGPVLGPLPYVHVTYCAEIKIGDYYEPIPIVKDLAKYKGVYYGDWSVFSEEEVEENGFVPEEPELRDTNYIAKYQIPNGEVITVRDKAVYEMINILSQMIRAHVGPDADLQKTMVIANEILASAKSLPATPLPEIKPDPVQMLLAAVKDRPDVLAFVRDIYGVEPE
jgi:hypothetical protein